MGLPLRPSASYHVSMDNPSDHPAPPDFVASLDSSAADVREGRLIEARTVLAEARRRVREIEDKATAAPSPRF